MQNQDGHVVESETETITSIKASEIEDWANFRDDDILQQQSAIQAEEAGKIPFVGDKARMPLSSFQLICTYYIAYFERSRTYLRYFREPLSSLAAEYKSGNPILVEKINVLTEQYAAIRRTRGDGNCFFRSFMFAYLEHILQTQDRAEVDRITANVEQCRKTLLSLGYAEFTFEDFFALFLEQLESVLSGTGASISHDELVQRSRDQSVSDYVVMFFRFITSGEIRKRSEFFEPFVQGLTNTSVEQFCKSSVEPMGEESDHVHITALSDALGVPIRIVYLDRSCDDKGSVSVNHHDFTPAACHITNANSGATQAAKPFINLLYRPGHYDILYPK
ncbi:UNVERIFIED_CONTAM: OVARIAN TUMOR DOMAIN-containing deubiquitinating enzyme 1 [Sesamum calycinum]|uniref:ubiquitinyl hydrolase 1 n=1 Tax=Sesamum calycinum TaxID=2727403 RepID=A0AAW2PRC4_9LAMI